MAIYTATLPAFALIAPIPPNKQRNKGVPMKVVAELTNAIAIEDENGVVRIFRKTAYSKKGVGKKVGNGPRLIDVKPFLRKPKCRY